MCLDLDRIIGLYGFPVGVEGKLRVDQDLSPARHVDDDVRPCSAGFGDARILPPKVDTLHEPGVFEQLLELHLTPLTA